MSTSKVPNYDGPIRPDHVPPGHELASDDLLIQLAGTAVVMVQENLELCDHEPGDLGDQSELEGVRSEEGLPVYMEGESYTVRLDTAKVWMEHPRAAELLNVGKDLEITLVPAYASPERSGGFTAHPDNVVFRMQYAEPNGIHDGLEDTNTLILDCNFLLGYVEKVRREIDYHHLPRANDFGRMAVQEMVGEYMTEQVMPDGESLAGDPVRESEIAEALRQQVGIHIPTRNEAQAWLEILEDLETLAIVPEPAPVGA